MIQTKGKNKKYYFPCLLISCISILIGIIIQASWIISDKTLLNWTIPEIHHFTLAGYYHAIFFVLMFAFIGFSFSCIWKVRHDNNFSQMQNFLLWLIVSAGAGFLYCLALDDWVINRTKSEALSIASLIVFVIMVLYCSTSSIRNIRNDIGIIISGECTSLGIVITALNHGTSLYYWFFIVIEALFAIILIKPVMRKFSFQFMSYIMIALPMLTLNSALYSTIYTDDYRFYFCFLLITMIIFLTAKCLKTNDRIFFTKNVPILYLIPIYFLLTNIIFKQTSIRIAETANFFIDALASFGIYLLLKYYISHELFDVVKTFDKNMLLNEKEDEKVKIAIYFNIIIVLIGAMLFFYNVMLISTNEIRQANMYTGNIIKCVRNNTLILVGFFIIVMILQKIKIFILQKIVSFLVMLSYYLLICWNTIQLIKEPNLNLGIILAIFPVCGASWMAATGYYNNLLGLKGEDNKKIDRIAQGIIFVGNVICSVAIIITIFSIHSIIDTSLMFIVNIYIFVLTFIVGPSLIGMVNQYSYINTKFIRSKAYIGIAQDGFTSLLIIFLAAVMPMYYYRQLSYDNIFNFVCEMIVGLMSIVVIVYWPYNYCLNNNEEHYQLKCKEYKQLMQEQPDNAETLSKQLKALEKHLSFQNKFSYISVIPYLLIWDVIIFIRNMYGEKNELFIKIAFHGIQNSKKNEKYI